MAHNTPQYNVKTGSDSQLFFSRETALGKIKAFDGVYTYPQLTRRTGSSIKGSTESIESSELRKGRTQSAPRKGNSSSEGSVDIELSPDTYDDFFEAGFRNNWAGWTSDDGDKFVNPDEISCSAGQMITHEIVFQGGEDVTGAEKKFKAINLLTATEDSSGYAKDGLLLVNDPEQYSIDSLVIGTEGIKYSGIMQYGGITGEDLYQEFVNLMVNSFDISATPGQIVTGSFNFMGSNNPKFYQTGKDDGTDEGTGFVATLKNRFATAKTTAERAKWIEELNDKIATQTDQFTAREGFLYINGRRVQEGTSLSVNLDNGLKQLFALFERDAVSTPPMTLNITGTLDAYLVTGRSEFLYNYGIDDEDVELVFAFQDKENDPDYVYVFQIFKAKFDTSVSDGSEEITISLPFTSFGERAMRLFRIRKTGVTGVTTDFTNNKLSVQLPSSVTSTAEADFEVKLTIDGVDATATYDATSTGNQADFTIPATTTDQEVAFSVSYKDGIKYSKSWTVSA